MPLPKLIEDNILITEIASIAGYVVGTDKPKYVIEEPQSCSIAHDEQVVELTGKAGVLIGTLKRGKSVTISYANGVVSFGAMGSQLGSKYEAKEDTLLEREVLTLIEGGTAGQLTANTTYEAAGTLGAEIASVAIVGDNMNFALLEDVEQGSTVDANTFTYDPATKELVFFEGDLEAGARIAVTYKRAANVGVLENDATQYAETDRWVIDAIGTDPCKKEYRVQIDAGQVDVSGTFTFEMGDSQTVQNVEGRCIKNSCGGGSSLYKIKVVGLDG